MPTLITRLSSNGVLFTNGTLDEITYTTNKLTFDTVYSGNFDETSISQMSSLTNSLCVFYNFDGNKNNLVTNTDNLIGSYFLSTPYAGINSAGFLDTSTSNYGLVYPINLWATPNTPNFSVSLWYNCSSTREVFNSQGTGNRAIAGSYFGPMNQFRIYLDSNRRICAGNQSYGGGVITSSVVALTGVWYHLAYVFNSSANQGTLYINNSAVGTNSRTTSFVRGDYAGFAINGNVTVNSVEYAGAGRIDSFGLWMRTLSVSEIGELYNKGNIITNPFKPIAASQNDNSFYVSGYFDEITPQNV